MSATAAHDTPLLISVANAAKLLDVSRGHVYGLIARGAMPRPVKVGDRTLFKRAELEAWVAAGCPAVGV